MLDALRAAFSGRLLVDATEVAPFLTDWRGRWTGRTLAVAQPDTAEDVAAVVRWCRRHAVAIVPQGGNTGLSGGATPETTGRSLVVSTARLDAIRAIDTLNDTIVVEAGVTLQRLQDAAREAGRLFPLALAAQGSCTVGGNLATNAGGVQVLRYGNARELCLGLEVVTADGEVWDGLRGLRKDNTGYALRDVFIGSEGTLGLITAATMKLFPLPDARVAAFAAVPSVGAAVGLLELARRRLDAALTAFELIDAQALALVLHHVPSARAPLADPSPWYVLIEGSGAGDEHLSASIDALLGEALELALVTDAARSTSLARFQALWSLRENVSEAQGAEGPTIKHDIALPTSRIPAFVDATGQAIARAFPDVRLVVFGHLGDGNLHYNVSPPPGPADAAGRTAFAALEAPLNRLVHDAVAAHGGSISAEHGLGVLRRDESARYKSDVELRLMHAIKRALDPDGLMNPGKVLGPSARATGSR